MILSKPNHIKIYGHRGARGDLPENTLGSFQYLFENNINAYETDVLISKDLVPVIAHDFRLDPDLTKDSDGQWVKNDDIKIFNLTYEELSEFDVSSINKRSRYGRRFSNQENLTDQKIPKLSELLELTSRSISDELVINLEIKSTPIEDNLTPPPDLMVKLVIDEVNKSNLGDRVIYSSFDWRVLKEIKNLNPKIARAYLTYQQETGVKIKGTIYDMSPWMDFMPLHDSDNIELPRLIKALGGDAWHPYHGDVKEEIIKKSHEEGLPVNVWTVNEEFDMMRMIDYGVDGIMTDYPLRLKEYCEKKNIKWF